jgi:hypothetical protein
MKNVIAGMDLHSNDVVIGVMDLDGQRVATGKVPCGLEADSPGLPATCRVGGGARQVGTSRPHATSALSHGGHGYSWAGRIFGRLQASR